MRKTFLALSVLALSASDLAAQTCSQVLGSLPANSFGGNGIPVNRVMVNTCLSGLTLGMAATPRGDDLPVTDNGSGTYFASAGVNTSTSPAANPAYAKWNFNWFVGGTSVDQYRYRLEWDVDPATGNALFGANFTPSVNTGDSWNLGMGFIDLNGPAGPNFDFNAAGEYQFNLIAYAGSTEAARVSMKVVTSTVPEPSTYALMGAGLAGLFMVQRRRRRSA